LFFSEKKGSRTNLIFSKKLRTNLIQKKYLGTNLIFLKKEIRDQESEFSQLNSNFQIMQILQSSHIKPISELVLLCAEF
jgi:hypothetical protein